jgi:hypothetical protein
MESSDIIHHADEMNPNCASKQAGVDLTRFIGIYPRFTDEFEVTEGTTNPALSVPVWH